MRSANMLSSPEKIYLSVSFITLGASIIWGCFVIYFAYSKVKICVKALRRSSLIAASEYLIGSWP